MCFGGADRDVQHGRDDGERDDADRQVDVEDPAPAEVLGEQPAEQRARARCVAPKTAPNRPWYLPRSRGGTMSPTIAIDSTISPPPPRPWRARKPISCGMFCAMPHSAEPIRKITMAVWKSFLRPYWSPSLPHRGVAAVEASRYAVTTQDRCSRPPRSLTMVGSAVETMVWSSAASSMPSSSAPIETITLRGAWPPPIVELVRSTPGPAVRSVRGRPPLASWVMDTS